MEWAQGNGQGKSAIQIVHVLKAEGQMQNDHSHEVPRGVKFIQTESKMMSPKSWGGGAGLLLNRMQFGKMKKVQMIVVRVVQQ